MPLHETVLTTCTKDCPDTCGISAHVTNGRLVGLTGAKGHEYTRSFLCRKALNFIQRVYSPERVTKPMRKVDGNWQDMSWDEALTLVAAIIKKSIDAHGSLSVLHYQSAGSTGALKMLNKRFFNLLGGVTEASGSLCGGAGTAGQEMDFGYRTAHDPLDLLNSRLIILWGRNPSETNMHLIPILKDARADGALVVLIDPINTNTNKFCDMIVKPNPGMDGYLALGIAKLIIDSGRTNMDFVANHTENFEVYVDMVKSYDIETLSGLSGVKVEDIELLARLYVEKKPAAIVCGWGLQRYQWGAETFRLIDALGAITGNIGIPGGGVSYGRDGDEYFDKSVKGEEFAKQKRKVPKPRIAQAIEELKDPPIKVAFINGANPMNQSPNAKATVEAFKKIDFVVVFEQYMTDTAENADVVLPVTTFLEETDVVASFWHSYIGAVNPAIEPVGEAWTDLEIYQALADRLGFGPEMAGMPDDWIRKIIKPLKRDGITLEALRNEHMRIPRVPMVAFEEMDFGTESKKFSFIKSFSNPTFNDKDYPLTLLSTHTRQWIHSQLTPAEHNTVLVANIHPSTAEKYGISSGEEACITSPVGEVKAIIEHNEDVKEEVVLVDQGRWLKFAQSANQLTPTLMSYDGENACYYQTAVRLEKV